MSCSKCISVISFHCLTWQGDPSWLACWLFPKSQPEGQGYKNVLYVRWGPPLPRKHFQALIGAFAGQRGRAVRRGSHCLGLSSSAQALKVGGPQEPQSEKHSQGALAASVLPTSLSFIFQHFIWVWSVESTQGFTGSLTSLAAGVTPSTLGVSEYQDSLA